MVTSPIVRKLFDTRVPYAALLLLAVSMSSTFFAPHVDSATLDREVFDIAGESHLVAPLYAPGSPETAARDSARGANSAPGPDSIFASTAALPLLRDSGPQLELVIDRPPDDPGEVKGPIGITTGSNGNIFVADRGNRRVQEFIPDGEFVAAWPASSGPGTVPFEPFYITSDGKGYLYVTHSWTGVTKYTESGEYVSDWFVQSAFGIAADGAGNVFVADADGDRIFRYTENGEFVASWGESGIGPGQLKFPYAIAVDGSGRLLVTSSHESDNQVQLFDIEGNHLRTISGSDTTDAHYVANSTGVAFAPGGEIFVTDRWRGGVLRFDSDGDFVSMTSGRDIVDPYGLTSDESGRIFIADNFGRSRIAVYDSSLNLLFAFGEPGEDDLALPGEVATTSSGDLFIVDRAVNRVARYTSSGEYVTSWGGYGTGDGEFTYPEGIAIAADGAVLVADGGIQEFDQNGNFLSRAPVFGNHLDVASDGSIFVLGSDWPSLSQAHVTHLDSNWNLVGEWDAVESGSPDFSWATDITVDDAGSVFVLGSFGSLGDERVRKYSADGTLLAAFVEPDELWQANGLDTDAEGNLFVAHSSDINMYSGDGQFLTTWHAGGQPHDVVTLTDGRIAVSEFTNDTVRIFSGNVPVPPRETEYAVLDPRWSYASDRHLGESRIGSVGTLNKVPAESEVTLAPVFGSAGDPGKLRLHYNFLSSDAEEFAGIFLTCGRPVIETVNPDGSPGPIIDLTMRDTCDFEDYVRSSSLTETIDAVRFRLEATGVELTLKFEVKDAANRAAVHRRTIIQGEPQILDISRSDLSLESGFDFSRVKQVSVIIEETNVAEGIANPGEGSIEFSTVSLVDFDDTSRTVESVLASANDEEFFDRVLDGEIETVLSLMNPEMGTCSDRTLFPDLLHVGAPCLTALAVGVERGMIDRQIVVDRALARARFLDRDEVWGNDRAGKAGNGLGVLYRFAGIGPGGFADPLTGTRKLDAGAVNNVEASVIDTALAWFDLILVSEYLDDSDSPLEMELAERVDRIIRRTDWSDLVDPVTGQFFLSWKPVQELIEPFYATPATGGGFFSSTDAAGTPLTIDNLTDEGALVSVLAAALTTDFDARVPFYAMSRSLGTGSCSSVVTTWPGSVFTHSFFTSLFLPRGLGPDAGASFGSLPMDWHDNASGLVTAIQTHRDADFFHLPDAVELPNAEYLAQGHPECAGDSAAPWTGTISTYSYSLAAAFGEGVATDVISGLKELVAAHPGIWDPRFGVLDAVHTDLSQFDRGGLLRTEGAWIQQQKFSINAAPAVLAASNQLMGDFVRRLAARNSLISSGIDKLWQAPEACIPGLMDTDDSGSIDHSEAVAAVVSYLLARTEPGLGRPLNRDEAIEIVTIFLTGATLPC